MAALRPGFVILDDGWLDTEGDLLNSFRANEKNSPAVWARWCRKPSEIMALRFLVHGTHFEGYWAGLKP
jgi:hypothetical protein